MIGKLINIEGIEIELRKKKIRNINLSVHPPDGKVKLSVPDKIFDSEIESFIYSKLEWIKQKQMIVSNRSRSLNFNDWTEEEVRERYFYLEKQIPQYIDKWEKITGLKVNKWRVKRMKTRWGSCNINTATISINLALAKKRPEVLEYIILHEMIHLLEKGHNKRFYAYMDQFLPNWRILKKDLTVY